MSYERPPDRRKMLLAWIVQSKGTSRRLNAMASPTSGNHCFLPLLARGRDTISERGIISRDSMRQRELAFSTILPTKVLLEPLGLSGCHAVPCTIPRRLPFPKVLASCLVSRNGISDQPQVELRLNVEHLEELHEGSVTVQLHATRCAVCVY